MEVGMWLRIPSKYMRKGRSLDERQKKKKKDYTDF